MGLRLRDAGARNELVHGGLRAVEGARRDRNRHVERRRALRTEVAGHALAEQHVSRLVVGDGAAARHERARIAQRVELVREPTKAVLGMDLHRPTKRPRVRCAITRGRAHHL